jgi:hypothetical protein
MEAARFGRGDGRGAPAEHATLRQSWKSSTGRLSNM